VVGEPCCTMLSFTAIGTPCSRPSHTSANYNAVAGSRAAALCTQGQAQRAGRARQEGGVCVCGVCTASKPSFCPAARAASTLAAAARAPSSSIARNALTVDSVLAICTPAPHRPALSTRSEGNASCLYGTVPLCVFTPPERASSH